MVEKKTEKAEVTNASEQIQEFINLFVQICRNATYNPQRKKVEIERLAKKNGISDH